VSDSQLIARSHSVVQIIRLCCTARRVIQRTMTVYDMKELSVYRHRLNVRTLLSVLLPSAHPSMETKTHCQVSATKRRFRIISPPPHRMSAMYSSVTHSQSAGPYLCLEAQNACYRPEVRSIVISAVTWILHFVKLFNWICFRGLEITRLAQTSV